MKNVSEEVCKCREVLEGCEEGRGGGGGGGLIEEVLEGLDDRLRLMDSLLEQRCDSIRDRLQEHTTFQVRGGGGGFLFMRVFGICETLIHVIISNNVPGSVVAS